MDIKNIIAAFPFAIIPALCWLYVYYEKDRLDPEPKKIILKTFLVGIAVSFPFIFLRHVMMWINMGPIFFNENINLIIFAGYLI